MTDLERATAGEDVRVDASTIEKSLAELWRDQKGSEDAITRAALWNVVARTANPRDHSFAGEVLAKASVQVPQRTIIVCATPDQPAEISSWISANCHLGGGRKQICSEEISIVASGDHVKRIRPLVHALLIPDMPVAVWWIGDLPNDRDADVLSLLEPADRLIVDSRQFDRVEDFGLLQMLAAETTTAPADLSWVRLEEWRAATASLFDPPDMRERLARIASVEISYGGATNFGSSSEPLLFAGWLSAQLGHQVSDDGKVEAAHGTVDYQLRRDEQLKGMGAASIRFTDGTASTIVRDRDRGVVIAQSGAAETPFDHVTRMRGRGVESLIVRHLKRPEADRIFLRALPVAMKLARRLAFQ